MEANSLAGKFAKRFNKRDHYVFFSITDTSYYFNPRIYRKIKLKLIAMLEENVRGLGK